MSSSKIVSEEKQHLLDDKQLMIELIHNNNNTLMNNSVSSALESSPHDHLVASNETFLKSVQEVRSCIAKGILPKRISKGSSGSYFCINEQGKPIAVFKPKNEEPYGHLNPKWTKFIHKTCCPCCFGRSCLIPNLGYISEASASVVDENLRLGVVPKTIVTHLASPSFHYGYFNDGNREKIGSFQMFMDGYMDSSVFLREGENLVKTGVLPQQDGKLHKELQRQFQSQFEKMVVLDFIIRNTDRGLDNWLVKVDKSLLDQFIRIDNENRNVTPISSSSNGSRTNEGLKPYPQIIKIAAIDNGLAFPFKHPDKFRSYPYAWTVLPAARVPFSSQLRHHLLPMLTSKGWWSKLTKDLRQVAEMDSDFDDKTFRRQVAVMKGQVYNLVKILRMGEEEIYFDETSVSESPTPLLQQSAKQASRQHGTPYDLTLQPPCLVWEDEDVRDLVQGNFGVEFARDGILGTIIGGIDAVIHHNSDKKKKNDLNQDAKFLTSEDEIEHYENVTKKQGLREGLDAFKGRVITFVKSQPWFRNW